MTTPSKWESLSESQAAQYQIDEIQFSGSTYQLHVFEKDSSEGFWVFLQFDASDQVKDAFCSCSEEECLHLLAAHHRVCPPEGESFHKRYANSLWRELTFRIAKRFDYSTTFLEKKEKGEYLYTSLSGKVLFSVRGKSKQWKELLHQMVEDREEESEENSLKFSNLSKEELEAWRSGKPMSSLQHELSFWGDLSKALFLLQDKRSDYKISFAEGPSGIPHLIQVQFKGLELNAYLSEANLPHIIPVLDSVQQPFIVHGKKEKEKVVFRYDPEKREMHIEGAAQSHTQLPEEGVVVGNWYYVSGDGFYPIINVDYPSSPVPKEEISELIDSHPELLSDIHSTPSSPRYELYFDENKNLHIEAFLFSHRDLSTGNSQDFGKWVYLDNKGFFELSERVFPELHKVILKEQVSKFISEYQGWLRNYPGFELRTVGLEPGISFLVDSERNLVFSALQSEGEKVGETQFGPFIYVPERGFFQNRSPFEGLSMREGTMVSAECVPMFIEMHNEELRLIPSFFSKETPITRCGLRIEATSRERVHIEMEIERRRGYETKQLEFFGQWVYVQGEGFSPLPVDPRIPNQFYEPVTIAKKEIDFFFEVDFELLQSFASSIDPKLVIPKNLKLIAENMEQKADGNYELSIFYESSIGICPISILVQKKKKGGRFLITDAGRFDLTENRFQWISHLSIEAIENGRITLTPMEILRLHAYEPIVSRNQDWHTSSLLKKLFETSPPELPELMGMKTSLRPYQEVGLKWLWYLYHHRLGGLLCDDMGLGKTHQAMALFAAVQKFKEDEGKPRPKFLVVCPTSVLYHWQDKLQEHLPYLNVHTYYGVSRTLKDCDLLLTSYGIWRRDCDKLVKKEFEVAILDEVQLAKNESSRLHHSLHRLKASVRLGLTGTPIENRLSELKALFDLVLPGYFPGSKEFREVFLKPIEQKSSPEARDLLIRIIHPFMLRRKKEKVLFDLPRKIEEIAHCPLFEEQRELYQQVVKATRSQIFSQLTDDQKPIPYMHVFAALTKLKQICNHPAVYHRTPAAYKEHRSGKWDLFLELLHEALDSRQKIVVYSQYIAQLDIIQAYLQEQKIEFAALRGSTVKRGDEIHRFHEDENCLVFVASLKAAGLGIDLTPASVVIHYDRWWNAAREDQATDRVHRIGQRRGVQVLKLLTEGTFEERIDALILRKAALMEEIVQSDEQDVVKQLDRCEILELFSDLKLSTGGLS